MRTVGLERLPEGELITALAVNQQAHMVESAQVELMGEDLEENSFLVKHFNDCNFI